MSTRRRHGTVQPMARQGERSVDFLDGLQKFTEKLLTRRLKKQLREKMKQQKRNAVVDWVYAIVWAATFVLVINQYVFQNYRIPSESMLNTLRIGDTIFVDKFSFGPELLPGIAKLPGFAKPQRGQVIVFENPTYLSHGPIFTILQQMIYMLTLTMVDIDRDQAGEQRIHYLIKRAVGFSGDRVRVVRGEVFIKPEGASSWFNEEELMKQLGLPFVAFRSVARADYKSIESAGLASAYSDKGLPLPPSLAGANVSSAYRDAFAYDMKRVSVLRDINPADARAAASARRYELGWYISKGRIFPMGDNRDNSRDARYFGPVNTDKVLGRALFIYWPIARASHIL